MVAPIFCVNDEGQVQALGTLVPVRPEGFVMVQADGAALHSDGLPWWLFDMRPQGYLGRAYASTHAAGLGLPPNPEHWRDADVIRALLACQVGHMAPAGAAGAGHAETQAQRAGFGDEALYALQGNWGQGNGHETSGMGRV